MTASTWAILRCKFADDTTAPLPDSHYQRLFTSAGIGSFNMIDFFTDMSYGNLDLSASKVFDWFTVPINKVAYVGNATAGPGQYNRDALVALCRQTAVNNGVNLGAFNGTLITFNGSVDLFGYVGGMIAFCDSNSLSPSPLGQEMGHGYGLDHARKDGSSVDYNDPWDVMSVYDAAYMAANPEWGTIGPGLNAWCMRSRGWLDESRVWTSSSNSFNNVVIELQPLHRRNTPGFLAASLGQYLIEYRPAQRWDAGFPRSAVFVHRFEDNHPYVMSATAGNFDLQPGDSFQSGIEVLAFSSWAKVEVISIDDNNLTATLRLSYRPSSPFPSVLTGIVGQLIGGVAAGGGGGIIVGGVFHPIPPRGPENEIVTQLASYLSAVNITDVGLRNQVRQAALEAIGQVVSARASQLDPIRSPAPTHSEEG